jgi:hypothetical protein
LTVLADHNVEGQARLLWEALGRNGWLELISLRLTTFVELGLLPNASDRTVWRLCQEHGMLLLTDNRNRRGADSLEQTIREENTLTALPVLTIGNAARMVERDYRDQCATPGAAKASAGASACRRRIGCMHSACHPTTAPSLHIGPDPEHQHSCQLTRQ